MSHSFHGLTAPVHNPFLGPILHVSILDSQDIAAYCLKSPMRRLVRYVCLCIYTYCFIHPSHTTLLSYDDCLPLTPWILIHWTIRKALYQLLETAFQQHLTEGQNSTSSFLFRNFCNATVWELVPYSCRSHMKVQST